mmetsp:Transcript_61073/g.108945  ORF Transcript_61073/g.108945 Transcript_61073/m.108945 type:complete len:80 (+) Transcript_61073:967-1206(+)
MDNQFVDLQKDVVTLLKLSLVFKGPLTPPPTPNKKGPCIYLVSTGCWAGLPIDNFGCTCCRTMIKIGFFGLQIDTCQWG